MAKPSAGIETKKIKWRGPLLLLFGVALLIFVINYVGFENVASALSQIKWYYLIGVFALAILMVFIEVLRFKEIVNELGPTKYHQLFPIHLGGMFINLLTPGARVGGEFAKAYYVEKLTDTKYSRSLMALVLNSLFYGITICTIGLISAAYILITKPISPTFLTVLSFVILAFVSLIILAIYMYKKGGKLFKGWLGKLILVFFYPIEKHRKIYKGKSFKYYVKDKIKWFGEFAELARKVIHKKTVMFNIFALQIIACFVYFTEVFLIARALNIDISYFAIIVVTSIALFIGFFMLIPGGVGVVEVSMIYLYAVFGVGATAGAAIALIDRVIFYLIVLGGGYVALMWLGWKYHVKPIEIDKPKIPRMRRLRKRIKKRIKKRSL